MTFRPNFRNRGKAHRQTIRVNNKGRTHRFGLEPLEERAMLSGSQFTAYYDEAAFQAAVDLTTLTVIDFDDVSGGLTGLEYQSLGVTFSSPDEPRGLQTGGGAVSLPNSLAPGGPRNDGNPNEDDLIADFSSPVAAVGFWISNYSAANWYGLNFGFSVGAYW
ncbi:MAG: hypothetical protein IID44_21075 [Planctomycetes bacterium]|nr:hypothetical protein [Planctomycetota bacterium]